MSNRNFKSYVDPHKTENKNDDNNKNYLKILIIALCSILLLSLIVFFYVKNDNDGSIESQESNETNTTQEEITSFTQSNAPTIVENETTQETVSSEPSQDGQIPDGYGHQYDENGNRILTVDPNAPDYKDPYIPTKEKNIDNPAPTGVRQPEGHKDHEGEYDLFDNNVASMQTISELSAIGMLSPYITKDGGYKISIQQILNQYGTEKAKKEGFRPWSIGEEHTQAWLSAANRGDGKGRIVATADTSNRKTEWYANNMVRVDMKLEQYSYVNNIRTPLGEQPITLYMKMVDNKWLIDAYDLPKKPTFY